MYDHLLLTYFMLFLVHCLFFLLDPKAASETDTDICAEWEIKTVTSALKTYLRWGRPLTSSKPFSMLSGRKQFYLQPPESFWVGG